MNRSSPPRCARSFSRSTPRPGVNLFEKTLDRIPVKSNQYEYPVIPDRSRLLDFETNRVTRGVRPYPRRAAESAGRAALFRRPRREAATGLCYTIRRLPRRRTVEEKKYGPVSDYAGTDVFLSLGERSDPDELQRVAELSVDALCTNRHLAEHLPVGESGADFRFLDDVELECAAWRDRPARVEPPLAAFESKGTEASTGDVAWRLVNMLSLNHLGLVERAAGDERRRRCARR